MSRLVKQWIPILIATITGLVVLAGYLFPIPLLTYYRDRLVEWAVIVTAFAFVLGLFNILHVHGGRVIRLRKGWFYSLVLLLAALAAWSWATRSSGATRRRACPRSSIRAG